MAVYSWIYANAKIEGNRNDYHVRVCGQGLDQYKGTLILLSNRLLSTDRRFGKEEKQNCWFSGYIGDEKKIYLVAVGGAQETILGVSLAGGGFRTQYCVLGYGFTENDIQLYLQKDDIFEPLKKILRRIQQTGEDLESEPEQIQSQHFAAYVLRETPPELEENYNIIQSTPAADTTLWGQSLKRPIMTGIISTDDAKRLLQLFPDGLVSVMEDVKLQYVARPVMAPLKSKGLDGTQKKILQEHKIISNQNMNINGKSKTHSNDKEKGKNKASKKIMKSIISYASAEEGKKERVFVQKCAEFCAKHLSPKYKESIQESVRQLNLSKEFSKQLEYYGYIYLWLSDNEEKLKPITGDEINAMIRAWAEVQKTEDNVFQKNLYYAKRIEGKDEKNGSI